MRILLVRHGESAANVDKNLYHTVADHDVSLSEKGLNQALAAGDFLNNFLNTELSSIGVPHKVRVWNSPYRRARQTAKNIISKISPIVIGDNLVGGKPKFILDKKENSRLCEQQYGLFDGIEDEDREKFYPVEGKHFNKCVEHGGEYWARMPLGESRFDVGNRVYETFGTFHRDQEKHSIDTIIVVCHGVTLRAFIQEWLHLSPEWFNAEKNPDNCWIRYLDNNNENNNWVDHGYIFTGKGNKELWPKQRIQTKPSPCKHSCKRSEDGKSCSCCKRTIDEIRNWSLLTTQERSDIFADVTLR